MRLAAIGTVATLCVVLCATASAGNPPDVVRRCFLRSDRRRAVARSARTLTGNAHRARTRSSRRSSSARRLSGRDQSATCRSQKFDVEREYGLAAKLYGSTIEIDHIVSLELGGSNDIANLCPKEATLPGGVPGYHVKDKLENKVQPLLVPFRSRCGRRRADRRELAGALQEGVRRPP